MKKTTKSIRECTLYNRTRWRKNFNSPKVRVCLMCNKEFIIYYKETKRSICPACLKLIVQHTRKSLEHFKTEKELIVYNMFRNEGFNPIWQYQIGSYIADFVFEDEKVIVELGDTGHRLIRKKKEDYYRKKDWMLIRITYGNRYFESTLPRIRMNVKNICEIVR